MALRTKKRKTSFRGWRTKSVDTGRIEDSTGLPIIVQKTWAERNRNPLIRMDHQMRRIRTPHMWRHTAKIFGLYPKHQLDRMANAV